MHGVKEFKFKNRIEESCKTINNERDNSETTQVQYTIINFEEMIQKIYFDFLIERKSEFCEYLKEFSLSK